MKMLKVLQSKFSSLKAVSPLDGRYEKVSSALGIYFSEMALMKYRIIVES
jgi:adenylosuccinate lyase